MKRIITYFIFIIISVAVTAQAPNKRCPTCGKSPAKCLYKGKHPKKTTPSKPAAPVRQQTSARPSTTTSKPQLRVSSPNGYINNHGWVDLGLSVKWATCNVGASSPEDYGGYYAWGEITTKPRYDWNNCFDCLDKTGYSWGIYKKGGKTSISPTSGHDTARENWGGTWRMPTIAEIKELNDKCKWTWTTKNGKNGYVITGPNSNSIFLPAAGYRFGTSSGGVGTDGNYWSSALNSDDSGYARYLYFYDSSHDAYSRNRRGGRSVRPVTE